MPIQDRSLGQTSRIFTDRLNHILNNTITQKRLSVYLPDHANEAQINFRQRGSASFALLRTSYGEMEMDLRQLCDAVPDEASSLLTLRTLSYRYAIRPVGAAEPILRWEYVRFPPDETSTWNRNHIQGPIPLGVQNRAGIEANLNDWHTPTGWIAIEDVLRFCITDLGVTPLSDDWDQRLRERDEQG